MNTVFAIIFGLIWGAVTAFINSRIAKSAFEKKDAAAAKKARRAQLAVDIISIVLLMALKNILPFSYEYALVCAIIAISILNTVFLFALSKNQ